MSSVPAAGGVHTDSVFLSGRLSKGHIPRAFRICPLKKKTADEMQNEGRGSLPSQIYTADEDLTLAATLRYSYAYTHFRCLMQEDARYVDGGV